MNKKKKQNKDLKIYANAKPKFKPKCLTSNVKTKLKKPQRQDQVKEKAKFIISWNNLCESPKFGNFGKVNETKKNKHK